MFDQCNTNVHVMARTGRARSPTPFLLLKVREGKRVIKILNKYSLCNRLTVTHNNANRTGILFHDRLHVFYDNTAWVACILEVEGLCLLTV